MASSWFSTTTTRIRQVSRHDVRREVPDTFLAGCQFEVETEQFAEYVKVSR